MLLSLGFLLNLKVAKAPPVHTASKPPPLKEPSQPVSAPPPLKVKVAPVVERKQVTYAQSKREPTRRRPDRESKAPRRSGESPISKTMSKPEPIRRRSVIKKSDRSRSGWGGAPTQFWKWLPALLGMPVEDEQPFGRMDKAEKPWLTWVLAFGVGVVSLLAMLDLQSIVDAYGLVPSEFGRMGGLTWLTAFFLHGGLLHLLGNLYFLVIFGDNVEKCLGSLEFFGLLCLATVCGHFCHILIDSNSTVPCIGASGGISGVIAFYALRFPKTQLAMVFWFFFKAYWWRMSAIWMFGIWVIFQFVIAGQQMVGVSYVSGGAHLGGALAGAFAWLIWRLNARADDLPSRYERS
ncbi:MAG: rhomboid family intramembrane serine protease [Opitutales bacterium]|nr:rhomboid family intramembrane serine protease [Opitutales bacterium]MDP4884773.1 rhomboid family intramembrane serine protease [Opitutales bacterium]